MTTPLFRTALWRATLTGLGWLLATAAWAHEYYVDGFVFVHPWAEATVAGQTQAPVYFTLDSVTRDDRLLRVSSPLAERVVLRVSDAADAPDQPALPVRVGDKADFSPGHPHVRLVGLKAPLEWGRSYPMTFVFDKAGAVQVMLSIGAH